MEKIWKKVGKQDNLAKQSSSSSKFSSNPFHRKQNGTNNQNQSNQHEVSMCRTKLDGSEYFNISQDSIRLQRQKRSHFEEESRGKQSFNIQFVRDEQSEDFKKTSQVSSQKQRITESLHRQNKQIKDIRSTNRKKDQALVAKSQIFSKEKNEPTSEINPQNYKLTQSQQNVRELSQSIISSSFLKKSTFKEGKQSQGSKISRKVFGEVQIVEPDMTIEFDKEIINGNKEIMENSRFVQSEGQMKTQSEKSRSSSQVLESIQVQNDDHHYKDPFSRVQQNLQLSQKIPQPCRQKNNFYSDRILSNKIQKQIYHIGREKIKKLKESLSSSGQPYMFSLDKLKDSVPQEHQKEIDTHHGKHGIIVRIKSGSRQKESLFFQIDSNLNKSDSFLNNKKKNSQQYENEKEKLKKSLPESREKCSKAYLDESSENDIKNLKPILMKSGDMMLKSGQSLFSQLRKDTVGNSSQGSKDQDDDLMEEEQIQQVIDLESQDFHKSLKSIREHDHPYKNTTQKDQSSQLSSNQILTKSERVNQAKDFSNSLINEQGLRASRQSNKSDLQGQNKKEKKKISLGGWKNESWSFNNSFTPSKSHQQEEDEQGESHSVSKGQDDEDDGFNIIPSRILKLNGNRIKAEDGAQKQQDNEVFIKHKFLHDVPEVKEEVGSHQGKEYLCLEEIVPIEESKEEDENCLDNSVTPLEKDRLEEKDLRVSIPLEQNTTKPSHKPQFSYQNFMNLVDEHAELKSSLIEYAKQIQSKDDKIHQLQLQNEKLKTDCEALRTEIYTVEQEKDELLFDKQMLKHDSEMGKVLQQDNKTDQIVAELKKENNELKNKIELLNIQINLLAKEVKEKASRIQESMKLDINSNERLSFSRRQSSNNLTGCFNCENGSENTDKKQKSSSKILKGIPTLIEENNFGSDIQVYDECDNEQNLSLSILLNFPSSKRLVLNKKQALNELQEYIFDLEQRIALMEVEFEVRVKKQVENAEFRVKESYSFQIMEIKQELEIVKNKYDKLKLWVKKHQKQALRKDQNKKQPKSESKSQIKETDHHLNQQSNSMFQNMLKNVSDFQQLFILFNQFNQMQTKLHPQRHDPQNVCQPQSGKSSTNFVNHPQPSLIDTQDLKEKEILLRRKEEEFERITKDIQSQWDIVEKEKRKCMSPPPHYINQPYSFVDHRPETQNARYNENLGLQHPPYMISNPNHLSYRNSVSSPYITTPNQNETYPRQNFNKFSSQVQQFDEFESAPKIEDSRSERQLPVKSQHNFFRSKSPQYDRKFCSEFDFTNTQRDFNMGRSKSPDLHYNYRQQKRRLQLEDPHVRKYEYRRGNNIFQDTKDISFISSKLSKLRNDIDLELKSIK